MYKYINKVRKIKIYIICIGIRIINMEGIYRGLMKDRMV